MSTPRRAGRARRVVGLGTIGGLIALLLPNVVAASASPPVAGSWGPAFEVAAALDVGGNGQVNSVSCVSAGNCAAGGNYGVTGPHTEAFLAVERNGAWGSPFEAPGTASFGTNANPAVESVSCTAPGDCGAAGSFTNAGKQDVFVIDEVGGHWTSAVEVPGLADLTSVGSYLSALSCVAPGDCAAGGQYLDGSFAGQAWIDGETHGVWGSAIEVPGTAALNAGGGAGINVVSCGAPGSCVTSGQYLASSNDTQVFVDTEGWNDAEEVPGTAALNGGSNDSIYAISCASGTDCTAGGYYSTAGLQRHAFVVGEVGGVWGDASTIPGLASLDAGGYGSVSAISCASPGNCTATGTYEDATLHMQAFAAGEAGGVWGAATEIPGTGALNAGGNATASTVSCAAPGTCGVGGFYTDGSSKQQAFVDFESRGTWQVAKEVPGTASLNVGGQAQVTSVACPSTGSCVAGGKYAAAIGHHGFLVEFNTPKPVVRSLGTAAGPLRGGTLVTILGLDLLGATAVSFGTTMARIVGGASSTSLRVIAPPGRGVVIVVVTTPGGSSSRTAKARYSYEPAPTVRTLSPVSGPLRGGTVMLLRGTGFAAGAKVLFGKAHAVHVHVLSSTTIRATTPAGHGTVSVIVVTPGGASRPSHGGRFTFG